MKVVYKKSIREQIDEEIFKASKINKEIEEILLNKDEFNSLVNELMFSLSFPEEFVKVLYSRSIKYCDVVIKEAV